MRLVVDEEQVAASALPTLMAGDSLAPELAWRVLTVIATGMPGSESARVAMDLAQALAAESRALQADLVAQGDRLAAASRSYASNELLIRALPFQLHGALGGQL